MSLEEYIKKQNSKLSPNSIKTYASLLRSLHRKIFTKDFDVKDFNNSKKVLEYVEPLPYTKRKTLLSALIMLTDNDEYRKLLHQDFKSEKDTIMKHEKTQTQEDNWVSEGDILSKLKLLKKYADISYKMASPNVQTIQDYVLLCLMSGIYIPPRRSMDWTEFKIKNINKEKDNYLDKNKLVFNRYKTDKHYGTQIIECPKELISILKKWITLNNNDYLLFDGDGKKLTSSKITNRFNKIFSPKKVSSNILRHVYLTNKFGDQLEKQMEIDKTFKDMGSSANQLDTYVKN